MACIKSGRVSNSRFAQLAEREEADENEEARRRAVPVVFSFENSGRLTRDLWKIKHLFTLSIVPRACLDWIGFGIGLADSCAITRAI